MKIEILYEDKYLAICVKPAGTVSEGNGMPELLAAQLGLPRVFCVHRLDRDVTGAMVYAKDGKTSAMLSELFSKNLVRKEYLALVQGTSEADEGIFKDLLFHDRARNKTYVVQRERKGVKTAELSYTRIGQKEYEGKAVSLFRIRLQTGRTHQIRVQFASRGMPLVGDRKYGGMPCEGGIALISYRLELPHPVLGCPMCFTLPMHAIPDILKL